MKRLPSEKRDLIYNFLSDRPEHCSALFLSFQETSVLLVDNIFCPKLLSITYPSSPPPMYFLYGQPDQVLIIKRLLKGFKFPVDLVIPNSILPSLDRFLPVRFSLPILFFAAREEEWRPEPPQDFRVRILTPADAPQLESLFSDNNWLWEFYVDAEDLLRRGQAAAAFIDGEMACVSAALAYTPRYVELGVVTRPEYRGRGLALECCRALSKAQYEERGRIPCWRTQAGNIGSLKVARNLGLIEVESSGEYTFVSNYRHVGKLATLAP